MKRIHITAYRVVSFLGLVVLLALKEPWYITVLAIVLAFIAGTEFEFDKARP